MDTDYRRLCIEFFGTDDIEELKKISEDIKKKNPRNAGRKKKFQHEDVENMRRLQNDGMTVKEIADKYKTARQVISRYLQNRPTANCTMRMTYMYKQHPCTIIDVDFLEQNISIENKTADVLHRAFGVKENPTWGDFECFLRDRCFPESRGGLERILEDLGLDSYDPLRIVEKTRGKTAEDDMWIKIRYYDGGDRNEDN